MPRKAPRMATISFKVEAELAEVLDQLPNKSEFIRKALAGHGVTCPLCSGLGAVARGVNSNFAALLASLRLRDLRGCGNRLAFPDDPAHFRHEDRARLEQFLLGGPLYCDPCYGKASPCGDCGWHIDSQQASAHRKLHDRMK